MLTQQVLEERLIYAVIVAGKSAKFADWASKRFLELLDGPTPFQYLFKLHYDDIYALCKQASVGGYAKNARCFHELSRALPDLATCSPQELEVFTGIGPKTSRFFITWTREGAEYAVLDTHILAWLREKGYPAPFKTPRSPETYANFEDIFLKEAKLRGVTPRQLDWEIWKSRSNYQGTVQSES